MVGNFKIEIGKNVFIGLFSCLRSKACSFKCGVDNKNKLKGIYKSQSKNNKFDEFYNGVFGGEDQGECDNYIIKSIHHDLYLQKISKNTPSAFD